MPKLIASPAEIIELCLKTQQKVNDIQHLFDELRQTVEYLNYAVQDVSCINDLCEVTHESYSSTMERLSYTDDMLNQVIRMMEDYIAVVPPAIPAMIP